MLKLILISSFILTNFSLAQVDDQRNLDPEMASEINEEQKIESIMEDQDEYPGINFDEEEEEDLYADEEIES